MTDNTVNMTKLTQHTPNTESFTVGFSVAVKIRPMNKKTEMHMTTFV